jgi:hypothetical protein
MASKDKDPHKRHGRWSKALRRILISRQFEMLLLVLSLLATVIISALTLRQATKHFQMERTSQFVARFNSEALVALREDVDRWLETKESPSHLYDRSLDSLDARKDALALVAKLRTLTNFFQEFGSALKFGSLDERYAHELLGGVCIRYATALEPFIVETRKRRNRPQVYDEVFWLRARMQKLEPRTPR